MLSNIVMIRKLFAAWKSSSRYKIGQFEFFKTKTIVSSSGPTKPSCRYNIHFTIEFGSPPNSTMSCTAFSQPCCQSAMASRCAFQKLMSHITAIFCWAASPQSAQAGVRASSGTEDRDRSTQYSTRSEQTSDQEYIFQAGYGHTLHLDFPQG